MATKITLNEALALVRDRGYVRIDQEHSATTEEEVKEIFNHRMKAWKDAPTPNFSDALAKATALAAPVDKLAQKQIDDLTKQNAELSRQFSELAAAFQALQKPSAPPAA